MGNKTALYDTHVASGARMVDFGGWDMPIHYGSQIEEHHAVRQHAGMFDVSHMTVVDVTGSDARAYLRYLLANDVDKLKTDGKALYSAMLNERGGVIDDLIVYRRGAGYRLVVNCATREKDLAWMREQVAAKAFAVQVEEQDLAIIAVQGPEAITAVGQAVPAIATALVNLGVFHALTHGDWFIGRTGYTGEDGVEMVLPPADAIGLWASLKALGVRECGLGARDTLRLEAGMNLYGSDMDEAVSPFAANMGWTLAMKPVDRNFIGRAALEAEQAAGLAWKLTGLVLLDKGVLRGHQEVIAGNQSGEITSGTFSPTLSQSIALARLPVHAQGEVKVRVRDKLLRARVVQPPFVRHGQKVYRD